MKLSQAFRLPKAPIVALVGAGGKTTALFMLAHELAPSLVTTTTHIGDWQVGSNITHIIWKTGSSLLEIGPISGMRITLITGEKEKNRYRGLEPAQLEILREYSRYHNLPLLIEADGARQKSLKAPADHEPAIPVNSDTVITVAGLRGVGETLDEQSVHRPEIFSKLSNLEIGKEITANALANFLTHPSGGLKNIPAGARKIALLNQADTPDFEALGKQLAQSILSIYDAVVIASLAPDSDKGDVENTIHAVYEQTAGIILAAGSSSRLGQPKQLLEYRGKAFVCIIAENALAAGLAPVIVVTGSHGKEIKDVLNDLPVQIVHNGDWQQGQGASIRAGIASLPDKCGSAIFLLADQPQVTVSVLQSLMERHWQDLPPVVAPLINDRRANPVLFDRRTFADLLLLSGDQGGRAIFSKFSPVCMEWADDRLLLDVDTLEDYHRLLELENDA